MSACIRACVQSKSSNHSTSKFESHSSRISVFDLKIVNFHSRTNRSILHRLVCVLLSRVFNVFSVLLMFHIFRISLKFSLNRTIKVHFRQWFLIYAFRWA